MNPNAAASIGVPQIAHGPAVAILPRIEASVPPTLDASSGSGSVKVIGASVQGSVSKRKVVGSIAGGGPLVKAASRSGSIVVRLGGIPNPG